jgi:hypothetical protein
MAHPWSLGIKEPGHRCVVRMVLLLGRGEKESERENKKRSASRRTSCERARSVLPTSWI